MTLIYMGTYTDDKAKCVHTICLSFQHGQIFVWTKTLKQWWKKFFAICPPPCWHSRYIHSICNYLYGHTRTTPIYICSKFILNKFLKIMLSSLHFLLKKTSYRYWDISIYINKIIRKKVQCLVPYFLTHNWIKGGK